MQSLGMKITFAVLKTSKLWTGEATLCETYGPQRLGFVSMTLCLSYCLPCLSPAPAGCLHHCLRLSLRKWPYGWRNLRNVISLAQRCWSLLLEQVNDTKSPRSAFSLHLCCSDSAMIRCLYLRPFTSKGLLLLFPNDISQSSARKSEAVPCVISSRGFAMRLCACDESLFTDPVAPKGNSYVRLLFVT